jgi:acetoin utilization deacetylase AcuC-like enzyme
MTQRLMELAERCCGGRIISVLEGGYNLDVLPLCIEQHLLKLSRQG